MAFDAGHYQDFAYDQLHVLGARDEAAIANLERSEDICLPSASEEIQRSSVSIDHPSMTFFLGLPLPRPTFSSLVSLHEAVLGSPTSNLKLPDFEGNEFVNRLPFELESCRPSLPPSMDEEMPTYIELIDRVVVAQAPSVPGEMPDSSPELDWESKKPVIHELYMKKKMALTKVRETMKTTHSFNATVRMYKRQFGKWRWYKYNSKQHRENLAAGRSVEKISCTKHYSTRRHSRRPVTRRQYTTSAPPDPLDPGSVGALIHQNDVSQHLNSALTAVRSFLYGYAENDSRWCKASRFDFISINSWNLSRDFFDAIRHLCRSKVEVEVGGRRLRRAFGALDELLIDIDTGYFIQLCCHIPYLCVSYERLDIAETLLLHVRVLAQLKLGSRHPLAAACMGLWGLLRQGCGDGDGERFLAGLMAVSELWTAAVGDMRRRAGAWGLPDRYALTARWFDLSIRGVRETDAAAQALLADYETLLRDAKREFGTHHDATLELESEVLGLRYDLGQLPDVQRYEQLGRKVAEIYAARDGRGGQEFETWKYHHQYIYVRQQERLCKYLGTSGELERAIELGRQVICGKVAPGIWNESWCLWLEDTLQKAGRKREAEEFNLRRLGSEEIRDLEREFAPDEQEFLRCISSQETGGVGTVGVAAKA